jgi:hypothetical protein
MASCCKPNPDDGTNIEAYVTWEEFCGGKLILPDSDTLLMQMERAFRSELTPSGVSDCDRCNREMQSVVCRVALTADHTFAAVSNYNKQALAATGAGDNLAILTTMTETNEVPCAAMVPSTALSDAAHAVQQLSERPNFRPLGIWYDIYPKGMGFWRLFWEELLGHLGGYHWGARITETLRQRHPQFHQALLRLSECVYTPHPDDERAVEEALLNGTMNSGKPCTHEDIVLMKQNGTFKKRYSQFIRKSINHAVTIRTKLTAWHAEFKATKSQGSKPAAGGHRSEKDGTSLFTPETHVAYEAALVSCEHLPDKIPFEDVYRKHNPPPGAKHGLPTYRAHRGESNLESLHYSFAHFGNTNMRPKLADMFGMLGLTRYNCQARERVRVGQMTAEEMLAIPAHQRGNPLHLDHSSLAYINGLAKQAGLLEPHFKDVRPLPMDNGERFLSEYLGQQLERNRLHPKLPINDLCQCPRCLQARPAPVLADSPAVAKTPPRATLCFAESSSSDSDDDGSPAFGEADDGSLGDANDKEDTDSAATLKQKVAAMDFCDIAPKPSVQYTLPHLQPPPVLTPMQQPPHFAPSAAFPFTYPHQVSYPHQPVAPASLPMAPYFHHWAARPAPALSSAKRPKPQREFCCQPYLDYFRHTKPFLGSKSGRPPHSPSCHKAKKQKQKQL